MSDVALKNVSVVFDQIGGSLVIKGVLTPVPAVDPSTEYARGVADERARVVAWLRRTAIQESEFVSNEYDDAADAIEAGTHDRGGNVTDDGEALLRMAGERNTWMDRAERAEAERDEMAHNRGELVIAVAEAVAERDALLVAQVEAEGELAQLKKAVTDKLHYDMKALLSGTPEQLAEDKLEELRKLCEDVSLFLSGARSGMALKNTSDWETLESLHNRLAKASKVTP